MTATEGEIVWLTSDLVKAIHDKQLRLFGGPAGLRDEGALESALGRPINRHAYEGADLPALAAAYVLVMAIGGPLAAKFADPRRRIRLETS